MMLSSRIKKLLIEKYGVNLQFVVAMEELAEHVDSLFELLINNEYSITSNKKSKENRQLQLSCDGCVHEYGYNSNYMGNCVDCIRNQNYYDAYFSDKS